MILTILKAILVILTAYNNYEADKHEADSRPQVVAEVREEQ